MIDIAGVMSNHCSVTGSDLTCSVNVVETNGGTVRWAASSGGINRGDINAIAETFFIDWTAPVLNSTPSMLSGTAGSGGWYTSPVSLTCSGSDALSGWASGTTDTRSSDGWNQGLSCTGYDVAGNSATASTIVNIDQTDPVLNLLASMLSGTAGGGGWYRSSVTLTCSGSDATSGWASGTSDTRSTEGTGLTLSCTGYDVAGNSATTNTSVNIDLTAPVLNALNTLLSGTLGVGGWYTSPVTLTCSGTDALSGWASGTTMTTPGDGWARALSCTGTDIAGNTAPASTTVNVDTVPPVLSPLAAMLSGTLGENGWYTSPVTLTCTGTDATSGWASGTTQTLSGNGNGQAIGCTGYDNAGNSTPLNITVDIDQTPPSVALQNGFVVVGGSDLVISSDVGSGLSRLEISIFGNGIVPRTFSITPTGNDVVSWDGLDGNGVIAPFGVYTFSVTAFDVAGNSSTTSGSWVRPEPPKATDIPTLKPSRTFTPSATPTPEEIIITSTKGQVIVVTSTPFPTSTPIPSPTATSTPEPEPAPTLLASHVILWPFLGLFLLIAVIGVTRITDRRYLAMNRLADSMEQAAKRIRKS